MRGQVSPYAMGFVSACRSCGVDPVALVKSARFLSDSLVENLANAEVLCDISNSDLRRHIGRSPDGQEARKDIDVSVDGLREAGVDDEEIKRILEAMRRVAAKRRR